MRSSIYIAWLAIVPAILISCKSHQKTINEEPYKYRCLDVVKIDQPDILKMDEFIEDPLLTAHYSEGSLIIANAFGLIPMMREYEELTIHSTKLGRPDSLRFRLLELEGDIDERLDLGMLEIISVGNRIDCAIIQLEKIKDEVVKANLKSQNALTNGAVIVGGAATVLVAGILVAENEGFEAGSAIDWIGVAGGVAAVYLALRSTKVDKRALVSPNRNVIAAFQNQDGELGDFPPSTWYLLNAPYVLDSTSVSVREIIIDTWNSRETLLGSEQNRTYFPTLLEGDGTYNEEMIELRIDLLETVGVGIDILLRSMYSLYDERK